MRGGVGIIRMHLNGKLVLGENEFNENWKIVAGGQARAAPLRGHLLPSLAERFALEWSRGTETVHGSEPGFTQRVVEI